VEKTEEAGCVKREAGSGMLFAPGIHPSGIKHQASSINHSAS
jgi:hypothetical protein